MNSGVSIKVVTSSFFSESNKPQKLTVFDAIISKPKTEECDRRNLSFCADFGMLMFWATSDFLEKIARVSFKVATKEFFRGKNTAKI